MTPGSRTGFLTPGVDLDPFQKEAIEHLLAGRSVVVCAPTGSGKTLIAEAAAVHALSHGRKLYYTTPLKALSNQKFRDFSGMFGAEKCGLLTGDIAIRPTAPLVVMTTEVLRNMLIEPADTDRLETVSFVVLDECHYLGRYGRGTVWEESILSCPAEVQIIALSATIANPEAIAEWIDTVHPVTSLVVDTHRPVPLRYYYARGESLSPLLTGRSAGKRGESGVRARHASLPPGAAPRRRASAASWQDRTDPADVVGAMARKDMLPAIYFVFSRRGCESALESCSHLPLLSDGERRDLDRETRRLLEAYPSFSTYPFMRELYAGGAVHHAGLLPAWKVVIENLFQQRLLKVIFATETLAAGINMPARSTVISSLERRGDSGYRSLTPTEFHQMSGRAGRRGMDLWGAAVVVAEPSIPRSAAESLALAPPEPLGSFLSPGYSLVISWLGEYGEEWSQRLIEAGLGTYLRKGRRDSAFAPAWRRFTAARRVLEHYGLLEEDSPTGDGLLVAALRAENELHVARILTHAIPHDASPALLAAGLAAAAGAGVGRAPSAGRASGPGRGADPAPRRSFGAGGALRQVLTKAAKLSQELRRVQREKGFDCSTALAPEFAVIVERWARGADWNDILDATVLDEGDIVYAMRTTIDLLEQVRSAPVDPALRSSAKEAVAAINRPPVSEVL